jgi:hypothetical protein
MVYVEEAEGRLKYAHLVSMGVDRLVLWLEQCVSEIRNEERLQMSDDKVL